MKKIFIIFLLFLCLMITGCEENGSSISTSLESSSIINSSSNKIVSSSSNVSSSENTNIPQGYYMLVDTSKTGYEFRQDLSKIISKGYVSKAYSSCNQILKESDKDLDNPDNIICLYTGMSLGSGWNKEHVWAKSHGFPENGYSSSEPYSDLHHLRPTAQTINSTRGNLDFGVVTSGNSDPYGNKWNSKVFEPRDEVKGDVARMMFYMATRYGFDNKFNLTLVYDEVTSGSTLNGKFGNLQTLIKWHYEDPVSSSEIRRNEVVYQYQKNRNPYIDHPEYVDYAYPNEYANLEVDKNKVNSVIDAVSNLPENITLENKTTVGLILNDYNNLNVLEKRMVTNYPKLEAANNTILKLLKEQEQQNGYVYSFSSNVFTANSQIKKLGDVSWKLSFNGGAIAAFDATRGLHVGSNKNPCKEMILTSEEEFKNVTKIVINCSGNSNVNALVTVSVGNSTIGKSYNITSSAKDYEFIVDNLSGNVSIIVDNVGGTGALYLLSIQIFY